jgi:hypothetical protein
MELMAQLPELVIPAKAHCCPEDFRDLLRKVLRGTVNQEKSWSADSITSQHSRENPNSECHSYLASFYL